MFNYRSRGAMMTLPWVDIDESGNFQIWEPWISYPKTWGHITVVVQKFYKYYVRFWIILWNKSPRRHSVGPKVWNIHLLMVDKVGYKLFRDFFEQLLPVHAKGYVRNLGEPWKLRPLFDAMLRTKSRPPKLRLGCLHAYSWPLNHDLLPKTLFYWSGSSLYHPVGNSEYGSSNRKANERSCFGLHLGGKPSNTKASDGSKNE